MLTFGFLPPTARRGLIGPPCSYPSPCGVDGVAARDQGQHAPRVAAEAPLDVLTQACDEVVCVVVGYLVMIDAAPYLGHGEPEWEPPLLCEFLNIDPSALAYFGLLVASFKRDPEFSDEVAEWLGSLRELMDYFVRFALTKIDGACPPWRP
jgi:hypothetical protein